MIVRNGGTTLRNLTELPKTKYKAKLYTFSFTRTTF